MALIKKRKRGEDEEEYEDIGEEPLRRKKKASKKQVKKKKEPPKPWGKKERILVLFFILLTAGTSAVLYLSSSSWKLPGLPRFSVPSINLPFSGQETIVIEGDKNILEAQEKSEEIISVFNERTRNLTGVYGFYFVDLETGFSFGVNELDEFEPASLNKLPVIAGMFLEAEAGNIDLETTYRLKNEDKLSGSGSLVNRPEGFEVTYRELVRLMGKESDNTAFNITRKYLGDEKIENVTEKIGMSETSLKENVTTPEDISIFFKKLFEGRMLNERNTDDLLNYLTDTVYEILIPQGLPEDVRVAHKYGAETNILNDAGIVYSDRPYVLVIMSRGIIESEAKTVIPELARKVYEVHTKP